MPARALRIDEARYPLERLEMPLAPGPEVLRRNASFRRDRGGFRKHERRAANRPRAKMGEMPIVRVAVDRRILAHRRNANAIGEVNVAQAKFAEEMRHGSIVRLEKTMREVRGSLMPPAEPSGLSRLTALRKPYRARPRGQARGLQGRRLGGY